MKNLFNKRLQAVRQVLPDGTMFFVSNEADVFYLTGFTGDSSYLLINAKSVYFISDGRYIQQIKSEIEIDIDVLDIKDYNGKMSNAVEQILNDISPKVFSFNKSNITLDFYEKLLPTFTKNKIEIKNCDIIENLRMVKDRLEIEIIKQNLMITELGFHYIIRNTKPNSTENQVAAELEYFLKKHGAKGQSFDTIVASGVRSALPHGEASEKIINNNEIVLFDYGIKKDGYCSDFTRCFAIGDIDERIKKIQPIVRDAVFAAQSAVRSGVFAKDIDLAARSIIEKAGYGEFFIHSTGHGVGIDIHEAPRISKNSKAILKEGMVFTIEPGIYLPDVGGIRLENMVVVTQNGCEVLTSTGYGI